MATTVPSHESIIRPEAIAKQVAAQDAVKAELAAKAAEAKKAAKETREKILKRNEAYVAEYAAAEAEEAKNRRVAKSVGDFYVPAQPKVVFVVRLRGICNIPPKPRKIMQLLRLVQVNNGVFVKLTNATAQMLQLIEPYVTYGTPSLATIRLLLYKRGYAKINGQRLPLSDNKLIQARLSKLGFLSVEDLVHEIYTAGPHFKQVTTFLWPFKLSNPTGGFRARKLKHFVENNGDTGDREHFMPALIKRMA